MLVNELTLVVIPPPPVLDPVVFGDDSQQQLRRRKRYANHIAPSCAHLRTRSPCDQAAAWLKRIQRVGHGEACGLHRLRTVRPCDRATVRDHPALPPHRRTEWADRTNGAHHAGTTGNTTYRKRLLPGLQGLSCFDVESAFFIQTVDIMRRSCDSS